MRVLAPAVFGLIVITAQLSMATPFFQGIGDLAGGAIGSRIEAVSGDGSTVVGASESSIGGEAFKWTRSGGLTGLGNLLGGSGSSIAIEVSEDGSVIVGRSAVADQGFEAVRWTASQGIESLGDLPGGLNRSIATGVSADGSVIVGTGTRSPTGGIEPFLWTRSAGIDLLGALPTGANSGSATGISGDGTVVSGGSSYNTGQGIQGTRWTVSTGIVALGDIAGDVPPPGTTFAGISADGITLVGYSSGNGPVIWTEADGFTALGDPIGFPNAFPDDVSGDGSIVVGSVASLNPLDILDFRVDATIWDSENGNRILADVLVGDFGIDLMGWELTHATGISDDGLTIVGNGFNPSGVSEGWIFVVPEPNSALLIGAGLVAFAMRSRRPNCAV